METTPPARPLSPLPGRKHSLWLKAGIGCGSALLLLLVAGLGMTAWLVRKGTSLVDQVWAEAGSDLESLRTEEGARALYRAHAGLVQAYPSEAEFLAAAATWRPRLAPLPPRPGLRAVVKEREPMDLHVQVSGGEESVNLRILLANGANLFLELDNGALADIRVE